MTTGLSPRRNLLRRIARSELGQMSIFLALVFQVLFVFFAMVINIGLLVHDKINLQNAVDLGAFYAAQKQAEILDEIAHLNYQIRQDYKLLAWRYWVVGTLGRDFQSNINFLPPARNLAPLTRQVPDPTPARPPTDSPRLYPLGPTGPVGEEVPVACLAHPIWYEFARNTTRGGASVENYCWKEYGFVSRSIAIPPTGGPPATAVLNAFLARLAQQAQRNYTQSCEDASPLSWSYVAEIFGAYKMAIAHRKQKIWALRKLLVSQQMLDKDGSTVRLGVEQTIKKNLTEENAGSLIGIDVMNGLTQGGCDGAEGANTLPEILTAPGLYYALLRSLGGRQCSFQNAFQSQFSQIQGNLDLIDPGGVLRNISSGEPNATDPTHSSLGFEKNPWCMAYVGVKARTRPRKPFAPFGEPVALEARAFAQPFGGRIGPWYGRRWPRVLGGTSESPPPPAQGSGSNGYFNPAPGQEVRTDPLTSPRLTPGSGGYQYTPLTVPNFSRFPGDTLGLRSQLTQAMARHFFSALTLGPVQNPPFTDPRMHASWFWSFANMAGHGDPLGWDEAGYQAMGNIPPVLARYRRIEMAAVAPDLFDVTYYSIDPRGAQNFYQLQERQPARYGLGASVPFGDLGTRYPVQATRTNSVEDQIFIANGSDPASSGMDPTLMAGPNYWTIRDWTHLLTAWAPHRVTNFNFPVDRFGKCELTPDPGKPTHPMIPGKCVAGGRSGYSVRLVARDHLNSGWSIGGDGVPAQPLLNPPGDDSQF